METGSPKGGVRETYIADPASARREDYIELYSASKAACWFLSSELSRRQPRGGGGAVAYVAGNPGTYLTNMWRYTPWLLLLLVRPLLRDPALQGADTYLWMGFSDEVTLDDAVAGRYAMCNGRWHPGQRPDLLQALREPDEGGNGWARKVFDWCEEKVQDYLN